MPRTPPLSRALVSALVLALAAAGAAVAQEPAELFVDRVDVNVVNVEVVVTDRAGNHVAGLVAEDFELYEDGRPVEISNFYAAARDRVLAGFERDRAMIEERRPDLPELPEDQKLNLLVYVDHYNLSPVNKKRTLDHLARFLEDRLAQGDRVMLVGYDGALRFATAFTDDLKVVHEGLAELARYSTHRQIDEAERRRVMLDIRRMGGDPDFVRRAHDAVRGYLQQARSDVRRSVGALDGTVRALSGLPGRRALVYVSEGLPMSPAEDLYQYLQDVFSLEALNAAGIDPIVEAINENERATFDRVVRSANANQVTFYTVDAAGSGHAASLSAEHGDLSVGAGGPAAVERLRDLNLKQPLIDIAEATGGRAVLQANDVEGALRQATEDFDVFYSLGYRSPHGGDGKYHKLEVKVKRPGLRARHRTGYVDKPEGERVADRTYSSLLFDMEANPLGIAVDFGLAEKKGRGRYHVPLLVRIPVDEVTLLPNGETVEGRLTIFLVVRDPEGGVSELHEFPYPVSMPQAERAAAAGREIGYQTTLLVKEGTPEVAVGVWDELSGQESFVHKAVRVGDRG